jgi:hypothetical protein
MAYDVGHTPANPNPNTTMAKKKPDTTEDTTAPDTGEFSPPKSVVLGDVVHYTLKGDDATAINRRRTDGASIGDRLFKGMWHPGAQAHIGEPVSEGDRVPMTVTKIEPAFESPELHLSGQCALNGTDSYWVRRAAPGDGPGRWQFAR